MQEAAYHAQYAAGLPVSAPARTVLVRDGEMVDYRHCASYLPAVQRMEWFEAAFGRHADPVIVVGGRGGSPRHG